MITFVSIFNNSVSIHNIKSQLTPFSLSFYSFLAKLLLLRSLRRLVGQSDEVKTACWTAVVAHLAAMEGQLSCLKFIISESQSVSQVLRARNNNGETLKMLAERFYKNDVLEYISNIEWERDHPEEAESKLFYHFFLYVNNNSSIRAYKYFSIRGEVRKLLLWR